MPKFLVQVIASDWTGIYVDGSLRYEGHSIPDHIWRSFLLDGPFNVSVAEADSEWLDEEGSLPFSFGEVKRVQ